MFSKKFTLGNIRDRIIIAEDGERLPLKVDASPAKLIAGLTEFRDSMAKLGDGVTEEQAKEAAMRFASVIFGADQAEALKDFYSGDAESVLRICEKYFGDRLNKKIIKAQKRAKK